VFVGGRTSITTYLSIHFVQDVGLDAALVGVALLVENLVRALLSPLVGALSDTYGRRALLLFGAFASIAVAPAFLLVHDPVTLVAWAIAFGCAQSPFFPVGISLLLDLTPPERHQTVLALNLGTLNVGYTLAMAPAGYLAQLGWPWLAAWGAAQFAFAAVVVLFMLRGPLPRETSAERGLLGRSISAFGDPPFLWLSAVTFALPFAIGLMGSVIPLYAAESGWEPGSIGLFLALNGAVVAICSVPVNVPLQRFGSFRPLPVACLIAAAAELALRESGALSLALAVSGLGIAEVIFAASLPAAIGALAPRGARGAYQGAAQLVQSIAWGVPLVCAGLARDAFGWQTTWTAFAAVTLVAAGVLGWSVRPLARRALRTPA
jgi:MFS family permease